MAALAAVALMLASFTVGLDILQPDAPAAVSYLPGAAGSSHHSD
jgi:hypothetical protein